MNEVVRHLKIAVQTDYVACREGNDCSKKENQYSSYHNSSYHTYSPHARHGRPSKPITALQLTVIEGEVFRSC